MPTSPFHRTNLNLYASDVAYMQHVYGRGWTEQARDIIHQELKAIKSRLEPFDELQFPGGEIVRLHKDGTISHGK